jgi:hypothetical protein
VSWQNHFTTDFPCEKLRYSVIVQHSKKNIQEKWRIKRRKGEFITYTEERTSFFSISPNSPFLLKEPMIIPDVCYQRTIEAEADKIVEV